VGAYLNLSAIKNMVLKYILFFYMKSPKSQKSLNLRLSYSLNLTESINLHSVFLRKTHRIGIEFFGKMKISKIKEHRIKISNVEEKQKRVVHLFIVIFMLLSN